MDDLLHGKLWRPRIFATILSLALAVGLLLWSDPDGGARTVTMLIGLTTGSLVVLAAHWWRKWLHDYPESDMQSLFRLSRGHPIGAGLALNALAIMILAFVLAFSPRMASASVGPPAAALQHLPTVAMEIRQNWPELPIREYVPGLIEHESCITLKHPRCWNQKSSLKTTREEGAGLGQLTRAYRADGSARFDSLEAMRKQYPSALGALSWSNVYDRPDLQIRAVVLMSRDNYRAFASVTSPMNRLAFTDAAYNRGRVGVMAERRACAIKPGCDPQQWFGNVEHTCTASKAALYAGRSPCDIRTHHVRDVLTVRAPKYRGLV